MNVIYQRIESIEEMKKELAELERDLADREYRIVFEHEEFKNLKNDRERNAYLKNGKKALNLMIDEKKAAIDREDRLFKVNLKTLGVD